MVLEVKCPISGRSGEEVKVDYIENGKLKKGHIYYAQVQTQHLACDVQKAHFYVYGKNNSKLVEVERDDTFI